MKIGILYPRSDAHPGMMMDFMDGIKTLLQVQQLNEHTQLFSESIGLGGNGKEVYEKAEKLLVLERVDMLVAYIDLRVLEIAKPLLLASGKLVLVVNPGANYPQNQIAEPNIIHLTLQHGFLCMLTGKLAQQMNKTKAAMCTTFYDSGYLHIAAMVNSFTAAAGQINYNYINSQRYNDAFDIKPLTGYLTSDNDTDSLLCVFDSFPAGLFYEQLNNFSEAGRLHLFVSPMMLEPGALEKTAGEFKFSIDGYLPWHPSLQNAATLYFLDIYNQHTKRNATFFSLLGWETGLIIQQILLLSDKDYSDARHPVTALASIKINSPRGEMKLHPETNYFTAPVCKCSIKQNSAICQVDWMEIPQNEWADFVEASTEGVSSGWTNTYLCY